MEIGIHSEASELIGQALTVGNFCNVEGIAPLGEPLALLSTLSNGHSTAIYQCNRTPTLQASSARFVHQQYWRAHGATLRSLMFTRFAILGEDNAPSAVVGIKQFNDQSTLVEKYLDSPIEQVISQFIKQPVLRSQVVEVGNLAADSLIQSCRLIVFLLNWLSEQGIQYATCTGTNAVRLALKRARVPFNTIGDADAERLGDERWHWGSYYDNDPKILLIDIKEGLSAVSTRYHFTSVQQELPA